MRSVRVAAVAVAVVLAADLLTLATGAASGDGDDGASATTTVTAGPGAVGGAGEGGATTTLPTTPAVDGGTTLPAGETSTTVAGEPTSSTVPPGSGPAMPAPGTYTENITGTVDGEAVPPGTQATFVVEQLNPTDQRHTAHNPDPQGPGGDSAQVLRYTPVEVLLVSIDLAGFKHFEPDPPVRYAPVPLTVGASWAWQMTSTDGATHLDQSSSVARAEQVTVAGSILDTFVIETLLTLSGDITGTIRLTSWASPAHALTVRSHEVTDVTFGIFRMTSDTTAELASLLPA